MTRVAVAGATGQVGREIVAALRDAGHEAVELARARGVDVLAGNGLNEALTGADAVIDVLNTAATDRDEAVDFFTRTTGNLLAAEQRCGVRHHVLLSIINVDAVPDNVHYLGKVAQEQRVEAGPVPWTILRAAQFHSFAEMVAGWMADGGVAAVAPLLVQPVDVGDVATVLVELALGPAQGRGPELAGPDTLDLVDMAVRTFAARGDSTTVRASWRDSPFGVSMAGEVLLPGPDARIGGTSFTAWLAQDAWRPPSPGHHLLRGLDGARLRPAADVAGRGRDVQRAARHGRFRGRVRGRPAGHGEDDDRAGHHPHGGRRAGRHDLVRPADREGTADPDGQLDARGGREDPADPGHLRSARDPGSGLTLSWAVVWESWAVVWVESWAVVWESWALVRRIQELWRFFG